MLKLLTIHDDALALIRVRKQVREMCLKGHAALLWLNIKLLNRWINLRPITFAVRSRMTTYCKRRYLEMTNLNNVVFNSIFYYLDLTMMPPDVQFDLVP